MTGFVGIEEDYPVSIKEVLNITAETGALETQSRIRKLPHYDDRTCVYIITKGRAGYNEEYKCSVCCDSFYWTSSEIFPDKFNYCRNCGRKIIAKFTNAKTVIEAEVHEGED